MPGTAADIAALRDGQVSGPSPGYTEDPARVARPAFKSVYGYHGAYADRLAGSVPAG